MPTRKPAGAKEHWSPSKGQRQCAIALVVIVLIIAASYYLSPKGSDAASPVGKKDFAGFSAVKSLDDQSFDSFVASHPDGVLVDFYSDDCKFCARLAPEFEKAAVQVNSKDGPPFAAVSAERGSELMKKFDISKYPSVHWFWKGQNVLELQRAAEKNATQIVEWTQWAKQPAFEELEDSEFTENLELLRSSVHSSQMLIVGFNREGKDDVKEVLNSAAQRFRSTNVFLHIKGASADGPLLKAFKGDAAKDAEYSGALTSEEFVPWVKNLVDTAKIADLEEKKRTLEEKKKSLEEEKSSSAGASGQEL